jgi:alpha-1,3-rhamnosyl/mannosyltransferase
MATPRKLFIEATPLTNARMSGIGHVLLETVRALDNSRYSKDYDIRLFVPWDELSTMERYDFKNIRIVRLPLPHKLFSLLSRMPIGIPLDLLLGRGVYIFPNFRNWNLLASKSYTYIHDVCFLIYPQYVEPRNLLFLKRYIGLWKRRADKIIAISQSSKSEIQSQLGLRIEDVVVVPNAVDTSVFYRRSIDEVQAIKKKYGIEGDYFLYVGNIEPRKNLNTLIKAFQDTSLANEAELFLVGGDGWLNDDVYKSIDDARCKGYTIRKNESYVPDGDLPALMSGAKALVQPSWHEGFGLATVQALACGTPNICSDIPGLREAVKGNEESVIFFNPNQVHQLTEALQTMYEQSSVHKAKSVASWNESADTLMKIIEGGKYE